MKVRDRRALLAYADWWFSRSPDGKFGAAEKRGLAIVNYFNDEPGRPFVAQSLAFDDTDGPTDEPNPSATREKETTE